MRAKVLLVPTHKQLHLRRLSFRSQSMQEFVVVGVVGVELIEKAATGLKQQQQQPIARNDCY